MTANFGIGEGPWWWNVHYRNLIYRLTYLIKFFVTVLRLLKINAFFVNALPVIKNL